MHAPHANRALHRQGPNYKNAVAHSQKENKKNPTASCFLYELLRQWL